MPLALHTGIRVSLLIQQGKALYAMQKFKLRMKLNTSPDMCLLDGSPCVYVLGSFATQVSMFLCSLSTWCNSGPDWRLAEPATYFGRS